METISNQENQSVFRKYRKYFFIIFPIIFFVIGFFAGWFYFKDKTVNFKPVRQKGLTFTNPLLECEVNGNESYLPAKIKDTEEKVSKLINEYLKQGSVDHVSVYFRDLNNGPWFGIGEDEEFTPASLLKVPVMIAFFKKAETNPSILSEKYVYRGGNDESYLPEIKPEKYLKTGETYTIEEAIEIMIENSDNNALGFLLEKMKDQDFYKVYDDLGLEKPNADQKTENFMTVKEYASFFRILYNASYLNREMSEKALELLSKTSFQEGLVKGVPPGIKIAHKFGERNIDNSFQLHDCGIIYYLDHPYILCVMSRGNNYPDLEKVVSSVSKAVYDEINQ
jgi:beta-lactamase class A